MRSACLLLLVGLVAGSDAAGQPGTPHLRPVFDGGVDGPTPDALLGFRFGASARVLQRSCERAGHEFERADDGSAHCSGAATPRTLPVEVAFELCHGRLCEARATVRDDAARVRTYARAIRAFRGAFGAPPQRRLRVDHVCLGELLAGRSDDCLQDPGAGVRHWWEVRGTEIFLALERGSEDRTLTVAYRSPERLLALSRTSD